MTKIIKDTTCRCDKCNAEFEDVTAPVFGAAGVCPYCSGTHREQDNDMILG